MYENSLRIAKELEAIADDIDNNESYEFDDNAECCFMESISEICRQQYEMILMHVRHLKEEKLKENELNLFKACKKG
jgi:hypothetical protein